MDLSKATKGSVEIEICFDIERTSVVIGVVVATNVRNDITARANDAMGTVA